MELSVPNKTMSSKEIAQITGKEHSHVLRDIRVMIKELEKGNPKMDSNHYQVIRLKNEMTDEILLNEELSLCLASGYNVNLRMKIIKRWKELEKPRTHLEVIQSEMALLIEKERLQKQIKLQEIKIDFIDRVLDVDEKIDIGQCAKILELPFGRNTLFRLLREKGVFFKNRNEPQQKYVDKGYFQLKEKFIERDKHDSFLVVKVLVTQRGLGFLSTLFKAEPKEKKLAKIA